VPRPRSDTFACRWCLDGVDPHKTAAENLRHGPSKPCGDWVASLQRRGTWPGFAISKSPGPGSKLTARQQAELAEPCRGRFPTLRCTVVVRLAAGRSGATNCSGRFGVALHRAFGREGSSQASATAKLSVRPRHPKADEEAQETFKKNFAANSHGRKSPDRAKGKADRNLVSKMRPGSASRAR